jgi:prepilin peptidase CpaA
MKDNTMALASVVLAGLLVTAALSDIRARRVSNRLNLMVLIGGLVTSLALHGVPSGIGFALGGVGVALAVWFPMFAVRLMGAGDVKLLAAAGAWLGWQGTLAASLATGVFGGILGALWLLRTQGTLSAVHSVATAIRAPWLLKMRPFEPRERIPYAVAIAAGVATAWYLLHGVSMVGGR